MALPILLFDAERLSPALGYVVDPHWVNPDESMASILWKFARLNAIAGHVVVSHAAKQIVDPYEGVAFHHDEIHVDRLMTTLQLPPNLLRIALGPRSGVRRMCPYLRWCHSCLLQGYHSVVHQFNCVRHCPIHRKHLEMLCPACQQPSLYRLHAQLLDAPYRCSSCGVRLTAYVRRQKLPWRFFAPIRHMRVTRLTF